MEKITLAEAIAQTKNDFVPRPAIDSEGADHEIVKDMTMSKLVALAVKQGYPPNDFVRQETVDSKQRRENAWRLAAESLSKPGIGQPRDLMRRARNSILHDESPRETSFMDAMHASPEELLARQLTKESSPDRNIRGNPEDCYGDKLLSTVENRASVQMMRQHKSTGLYSMMDVVRNFSRDNPEAVEDLAQSLSRLQDRRVLAV